MAYPLGLKGIVVREGDIPYEETLADIKSAIKFHIETFEIFRFKTVKVGNHISMIRKNPDGRKTSLTMPIVKLPEEQNRRISSIRAPKERPFSVIKTVFSRDKTRYKRLKRVNIQFISSIYLKKKGVIV